MAESLKTLKMVRWLIDVMLGKTKASWIEIAKAIIEIISWILDELTSERQQLIPETVVAAGEPLVPLSTIELLNELTLQMDTGTVCDGGPGQRALLLLLVDRLSEELTCMPKD